MGAKEERAAYAGASVVGLLLLMGIRAVGASYANDFAIFQGGILLPNPTQILFFFVYCGLGMLGVAALTYGVSGLLAAGQLRAPRLSWLNAVLARWGAGRSGSSSDGPTDRQWIVLGTLLCFLVPFALRLVGFQEGPITDDEDGYLFSARVLASGRIAAEPPPLPEFFDRQFMRTEGRWISQYFLGWPGILAPFAKLGLESLANPLLHALTAPPTFLVLRRLAGARAARIGVALLVCCPTLAVSAATLLSHTAGACLLAWMLWLVMGLAPSSSAGRFCALSALFSIAFFVRPLTAIGFGTPILALSVLRICSDRSSRLVRLAALALPAIAFGSLFLWVNFVQTGSPWMTAYEFVYEFKERTGFEYASLPQVYREGGGYLSDGDPMAALALASVVVLRMNVSLFGWPLSFALLPFAYRAPGARPLWLVVLWFLVANWFTISAGVTLFAPMHYIELAVPLVMLSAMGYCRLRDLVSQRTLERFRYVPSAFVVTSVVLAALIYVPVRVGPLIRGARDVGRLRSIGDAMQLGPSVVFTGANPWSQCNVPPRHLVLARPENDPSLSGPVIWANYRGPEGARKLMEFFPGRTAHVFAMSGKCDWLLMSLEQAEKVLPKSTR